MKKKALVMALLALGCGGKGAAVMDARPADSAAGPGDAVVGGKVEAGSLDTASPIDAVIPSDLAATSDAVIRPDTAILTDTNPPSADGAAPADAPGDAAAGASPDALPAGASPDALPADASLAYCLTVCLGLEREYATAFALAAACNPTAADQCRQPVTRTLTCGCPAFVNDGAALGGIRTRWQAAGCDACASNCTPLVCPPAPAPGCNRTVTGGSCANALFP